MNKFTTVHVIQFFLCERDNSMRLRVFVVKFFVEVFMCVSNETHITLHAYSLMLTPYLGD